MVVMTYFALTAIVAFLAGINGAWLPAIGFATCAAPTYIVGYNLVAGALHLAGVRRILVVAAQFGGAAGLEWLSSLTGVVAGIFDLRIDADTWIVIGLMVGAWYGFTTPPSQEEIVEAQDGR